MKKAVWLLTFFLGMAAWAQPEFNNIDQSDFEGLSKEFSSNFSHNTVMGAEPLGDVFGFELSLIGGSTNTPKINSLSNENGSGLSSIMHAGVILGVSVPMGFTFELLTVPRMDRNSMSFTQNSVGIKWTSDKDVIMLPFHLAFRGFLSSMSLGFTQDVTGAGTTVDYTNNQTGFQMLISPGLPAFEPYLGLGYITSKNNLKSSATIFDAGYTTSQESDISVSSMQTILGLNFYAGLFALGVEYQSAFGTSHTTAKFGFYF